MKKLIIIFTILAAVSSAPVMNAAASDASGHTQGAAGQYWDMAELYQYWEDNGYPDYVGGVYCTGESTSHLTVLLAGDDGSGEQQIRDSLIHTFGLSFGTSQYSYNALLEVNEEIVETYLLAGSKIYSVGVGWTGSDGVAIGYGPSGKEFRVVVSVDESVLTEYQDQFHKLYGDMVEVKAGSPLTNSFPAKENLPPLWLRLMQLLIPIIAIICVGLLLIKFFLTSDFFQHILQKTNRTEEFPSDKTVD